nr:MAG TPA: hypothetical protein [Caudoviricetes sp.]DAT03175.1 MAG TPA: hypothetical protein [Caudoviricetes sp.]
MKVYLSYPQVRIYISDFYKSVFYKSVFYKSENLGTNKY